MVRSCESRSGCGGSREIRTGCLRAACNLEVGDTTSRRVFPLGFPPHASTRRPRQRSCYYHLPRAGELAAPRNPRHQIAQMGAIAGPETGTVRVRVRETPQESRLETYWTGRAVAQTAGNAEYYEHGYGNRQRPATGFIEWQRSCGWHDRPRTSTTPATLSATTQGPAASP